MGATRDDFVKYPRTPHLFGSKGTDDDKHLGRKESEAFIADPSLIVEEKIDGTNVGIHFTSRGRMVLQCRGHEITEGMHPQYDLFKQWTSVKHPALEAMLDSRAFDNPVTGRTDHLMEGLYVRTEAGGHVTGRAKMVRPEFVEKVKQSEHWQHQAMVPNELAVGAEIWA